MLPSYRTPLTPASLSQRTLSATAATAALALQRLILKTALTTHAMLMRLRRLNKQLSFLRLQAAVKTHTILWGKE